MKPNTKIIMTALVAFIAILLMAQPKNESYTDISFTEDYSPESNYGENSFNSQAENQQPMKTMKTSRPAEGSDKIEMKKIVNPQTGKVAGYMPLPTTWNIIDGAISGPNGIVAKEYAMKVFDSAQRRPMSAQQILRQELAPSIQKAGGKIQNTFPIPGIMKYDENYSNQLYGANQTQRSFDVIGVDLIDQNGKPNFIIIRQIAYSYGYGGTWGYMTHTLECQPSEYESARDAYIYGLVNAQNNPDQIADYNRNEAMKSEQSWAAHNTKMRNNQAAFDARNRAYTTSSNAALDASMERWRTNNEISDMSMNTWKSTNASSDRMQDMTVNGIHEWENVYNTNDNSTYKVDAGYDRYFMNGQGEYFGTNDQFYQPGQDVNLNGTWNEIERKEN